MPTPECNWCGRYEDLQEYGADMELLCQVCREVYDENEAINERDKVLEDRRLWK
jgi:CRISPR/Cas system-associated protein Cas10 (large subunit of type III CRISPR-Cas system)